MLQQTSTSDVDSWPRPMSDSDIVNSRPTLASLTGVVMTTGDVISMATTEAAYVGGSRPRREHGQCTFKEVSK